ncbi:hypothetical protein BGZ76_004753 [Entomortierella beljakovae]|nr:hypothetical protein BGZ76_004753 [Entomortierella beljakovae]
MFVGLTLIFLIHHSIVWIGSRFVETTHAKLCDPQPNIWSLNALRDKGENTESYEAQPSVPMSFAVSGDGNYIAFFTKSNSAHFIDLWDVRSYEASSKGSNTGTFLDPIPCTSLRIPDAPKGNKKNLLFTISVSWDASYIAYSDATPLGESLDLNQSRSKGASTIYKRQNNQQVPADPPSSINLRFKPMTNLENIPGLSNISGHGKFNSTSMSRGYDVPVEFSNDGSQLVIHGNGVIKTFLTNTGENIGTYNIPDWCKTIHSFRFIKHNTQILVETLSGNDMFGKGRLGIVLKNPTVRSRVPSIIQEDVILCPGTFIKALPTLDADGKQRLLSVSGLMINLNVIDDYIVSKYIHPEQHWNKTCIEQLKPLSECPEEFTTPSGLNFKVEIRFTPSAIPGNVRSAPSVIVTTTAGNRRREFEIPPYFIKSGASHGYQCARILDINLQLVVISTTLIMIWKLPSTIDGEFSLLLYWDTPINIQANVNLIDITLDDEWWNGVSGPWHICSHQKLRAVFEFDGDQKVLTPSAEDPLAEKMSFHTPLSYNVHLLYAEANEACRKAIVRYFGLHMNSYSSHDNDTFHVLELIARFWQPILQIQFEAFVGDLLDGTNGTWIPPECQDYKNNPLSILYEKVKKNPRAIVVAETIIDHCIRHSRLEKNPLIIQPVIRTLGKLLDPKIHQPDIALRTLQRLAFLRAVNRLYIIDNHTIALPPLARLRFWDKESQMLFRCKNPILQLNLSPGAPNPLNENFTKDLFEAWFEMIWSVKGGSESCGTHYSQSNRTVIGPLFHWIFVMMCIFWCKCRPWSEKHIKSHDFTLESLDNPAIAALIEYKCLIVFVIVKQVNNERLEPLWGICVTIIACSTIFLLLEVGQGGRYDQIEDEMNNKESWAFQALMIIFFFFTVILMLNVLIALINKAFNDGDETWRLVWLENRLRTIESAEDISFKIPGFRESHNWFPESIYYSASSQQIRAYELKYFENNGEFTTDQNGVVRNNDALEVPMNVYLKTSVQPGFFNFIDTPEEQAARNGIAGKSAAVGHEGALPTSNPNPNNNQSAATTQDAEVEPSYSDNQANIDNQSENITQLQQSFATVQQELAQSRSEVLELQTQLLAQNTRLEAQLKEQSQQLLEQNRQLKEQNSQFQENLQAVLSEFLKSNLKEM